MKLLKDRFEHKTGTTVYKYNGYDYGLLADDEALDGGVHIMVTLDPSGGTPFFTVPLKDVK